MASKTLLLAVMIALMSAAPAFGTDYVVGDDWGWTLGFDYTAWAQGKQFWVGDTIRKFILLFIFLYINITNYISCNFSVGYHDSYTLVKNYNL